LSANTEARASKKLYVQSTVKLYLAVGGFRLTKMAPPEVYSAEWNASCALRPATARIEALVTVAYINLNLFFLIFCVIYYSVGITAFWYVRSRTRLSYLRKRSLVALALATLGTFWVLVPSVIRDLYGRTIFPCYIAMWSRVIASKLKTFFKSYERIMQTYNGNNIQNKLSLLPNLYL
jgi:hypothetical protein